MKEKSLCLSWCRYEGMRQRETENRDQIMRELSCPSGCRRWKGVGVITMDMCGTRNKHHWCCYCFLYIIFSRSGGGPRQRRRTISTSRGNVKHDYGLHGYGLDRPKKKGAPSSPRSHELFIIRFGFTNVRLLLHGGMGRREGREGFCFGFWLLSSYDGGLSLGAR